MTYEARGTFEVQMTPQNPEGPAAGAAVSRLSLEKVFHGDLEARSSGQMLAVQSDVAGSAGYVAMEQVRGTLHGRSGTFALQHTGVMTRGAPSLTITVVPDSGTEQLAGLAGSMRIDIVDGQHYYNFAYMLPDA